MPAQHSHHDRGALHDDCPACITVAKLLGEAGVPAHQISDLRRDPVFSGEDFGLPPINAHRVRTAAEEHVRSALRNIERQQMPITINYPGIRISDDRPDLDIEGQEMGNKASVDVDRADEHEFGWLSQLTWLIDSMHMGYGNQCLYAHVYLDHEHQTPALDLNLRQLQEIHASLHHQRIGHPGSAEHMVERVPINSLHSARQTLSQAQYSKQLRQIKNARVEQRAVSARAQRAQVLVDSARALKRAIDHAKGTVLPRVNYDATGTTQVSITVGIKDRVTIAAASIGNDTAIGTAICHPSDRFDEQVGRQLAIARSLVALGAVHELEWMAKVEEHSA